MRTMMRTLFSETERYLIRNQYNTVLDSSSASDCASSSGSDINEHQFLTMLKDNDSIFAQSLLLSAFKRYSKFEQEGDIEKTKQKGKSSLKREKESIKLESLEDETKENEVTLD